MRNRGRTAAVIVGVTLTFGLATHALSAQDTLPPGWRQAQPNELVDAGAYTLRAPEKPGWRFLMSADRQRVQFERVAENALGGLLWGQSPRSHSIVVQRGTVPDEFAQMSDSALVDSLFEELASSLAGAVKALADVQNITEVGDLRTKRQVTGIDGRIVYRLEHSVGWSVDWERIVNCRGLALVYFVHPPDGPRIWYMVDGDVLSSQGAKPDEKVVRAMLLSIAEAKPLVQ